MKLFLFTILLSWSACTEPIQDIPPCNDTDPCAVDACQPENCVEDTTFVGLDTLWKTNMEGGSIRHMLMDANNIYVNVLTSESFYIASYDRSTGKRNWKFSNELGSISAFALYEDQIIAQNFNALVALDKETGQELIRHNIRIGKTSTTYGYILGSYYYTSMLKGDESEAYLVRSQASDLQNWEIVYTVTKESVNGSQPDVESTNRWVNPITQDEILVFQHRMAFPNRVDFVAYNLTADSLLWWHEEIDENANSNIRQITISQGRAYFQGTSKLRCFDIATGDLIWETNYGPWNQGGKFFAAGSIVFTASEEIMVIKYGSGLLALNALTGEELWDKNDDDIRNVSSFFMTMYNDIVFFTHPGNGLSYSGPLWAIRASDGEEIWMKSTDFTTTGDFNGPVLIDEERLLFYTRHEGNLIAFRMPEDMY